MADATQILRDAPAQIAVYDATNDELFLGYLDSKKISLTQKPLYQKNISGQYYQYGVRTVLRALLLETDPAKIANLKNRRTLKQDIYITTAQYGIKMHDTFINHAQKRSFEPGKSSHIEFTAYTDIETDVEVIKNLFSSVKDSYDYGGFEVDTNTDGLGDGWIEFGGSPITARTDPSFLNGAGNYHQDATLAAGEGIRCDTVWYFDQSVTLTFSVNINGTSSYVRITLSILDIDDNGIQTDHKDFSISGASRVSHTIRYTGLSVGMKTIRCDVTATGAVVCDLDDCQLEFGKLTDYTEND